MVSKRLYIWRPFSVTAIFFLSASFTAIMAQDGERPLKLSDIMPTDKKLYDKMRPPKFQGNATEVLFHVTVMSLDTIDESSMTYTCDVFFAQSWHDDRLRLPDNMTSEYRLLPIEWLTEIWRPDSYFKNAKDVTFQTMTIPNHYIWLWKDKSILYMVKLTLVLSCPMHFKNYPHDTQECNLEIESISHTTDDLIFIWDPDMPLDVDKGIELPQLELISTKSDDCTTDYSTGRFTCLEVVFMFKRRLGYYLFHTYVPTCLIVIMSWISFWIKPEAVPARVTLGVTSLLTLSTQHANSQKSLPPVSYIKAIDVFMSGCTVFVFLSLMEYALVNIVMGDIADIEKKKSMGISNLILGTRGIPLKREKDGTIENDDMLQYGNHDIRERSYTNLFSTTLGPAALATSSSSHGGDRTKAVPSQQSTVAGSTSGHTCTHSRAAAQQQTASQHSHDPKDNGQTQETVFMHDEHHHHHHHYHPTDLQQQHSSRGGGGNSHVQAGSSSGFSFVPPPPPPPSAPATAGGPANSGPPAGPPNSVINQQGIRNLVHDVQLKRQKEIRDMMKKKREKAVLVDRISRWLFPTSFILLNILYWALFGDHELW